MGQNNENEELVLKSVRVLAKSGYIDEAKMVLEKLPSPQAKTLLAKMGGTSKAKKGNNNFFGLVLGSLMIAVLAFFLGWNFAPKSSFSLPANDVNSSIDVEAAATATEGRLIFDATTTAIEESNETIMMQISASQTAAVEAATATAAAQGQ
jgi:tetrahydromethanopterin S-methyltransferase subunit B